MSAARDYDWVVHMDEETRFTEDTVAHVLEHCLAENELWQATPEPHPISQPHPTHVRTFTQTPTLTRDP